MKLCVFHRTVLFPIRPPLCCLSLLHRGLFNVLFWLAIVSMEAGACWPPSLLAPCSTSLAANSPTQIRKILRRRSRGNNPGIFFSRTALWTVPMSICLPQIARQGHKRGDQGAWPDDIGAHRL